MRRLLRFRSSYYATACNNGLPPTHPPEADSLTETLDSKSKSKSKLRYYRRPVGNSVLVLSPIWGPRSDFILLSDGCGIVNIGRPL
jgi:hypothetical protein